MSITMPSFVTEIYHYDKQYTPKQVVDYISQTSGEDFADPQQIKFLKIKSQSKAKSIIEKYSLKEDQILQRSSSEAGKSLAELLMIHSCEVVGLIQKGAFGRGILI